MFDVIEHVPDPLGDLRKEIDRIDEAMHQLLIERSEIIDRLIAQEQTPAQAQQHR